MNRICLILICLLITQFVHSGPGSIESQKIKQMPRNNTVVIKNQETPKFPGKSITFKKELVVGENLKEITIYKPSIVQVDENGNIFVYDSADSRILVFDNKGKFKHKIGNKGEGPGEYKKVSAISTLPNNRIVVLDYKNRRTSIFDVDGTFIKSWKWFRNYHLSTYVTADSFIVCDNTVYGKTPKLFVNKYDYSGKEILSYGEFTPQKYEIHMNKNIPITVFPPHSKRSLFTGSDKHQLLYHCLNDKYEIEIFDKSGTLVRKIARPGYQTVPFTEKDEKEYFNRVDSIKDDFVKSLYRKVKLPKSKSVIERLLTDHQGNLWVQTNEAKKKDGKHFIAYDIYDRDGTYMWKIWSDIYPYSIKGGKVYSIVLDEETEDFNVIRYSVKWNDETRKRP